MYKVPTCKTCDQSFYVRERTRRDDTGRAPLVLDCGHNFCEQCISKMASVTRNEIMCHTCKVVTPLREGHNVKSVLPVNSYIVGQTILSKQLLLDDSVLKMVPKVMKTPSPGVKQGKTRLPKQEPCGECSVNAATCRCYKCDCVLCGACFDKVHAASKMLRTHQAIPLYESDRYEKIATVCPEHDNRPIEYFCEDDQAAICSHCVIVGKHQNHAINSIEDKNKEAIKSIDPALNHAQMVFQILKRSDKQLHGIIPSVQRDMRGVIEDIRNQFLHIHSLLIAREKAMIHEMEKLCIDEVTPIEEMRVQVSEDLQKVASITRDAAKLKQSASLSVLNAQAILDSLNKLADMPCHADIKILPDSGIRLHFDDSELERCIQSYGKLEGSPAVSIKLLQLNEIPDDLLETASVTSDSTSVVSSEKPLLPKENAEGSESDAPVDTVSLLSDTSATDSVELNGQQKYPKGLRRSRINLSRRELVHVSHIKNPSNFMIQKDAIMEDLKGLSRKINQYCSRPDAVKEIPLSGLEPEAIVLARFTKDNMWYRARVLSYEVNEEEPLQSQVEVMYVDYGNSEIIPLSRIRNIPSRFTKMSALAMKCALYDLLPANDNQEWTLDSLRTFLTMVNDKKMLCLVKAEKDGILQVDLSVPPDEKMEWDQPVSMRDALVFLEHAWFKSSEATPLYPGGPIPKPTRQYLRPPRPPQGATMTCIISHVNSPQDFFIQQLGEEAQYLTNMMRALQEEYNADTGDLWSIFCPQKGMLCAAQYTIDDQWYRAEVINTPGRRNVEVVYVDYGNTEVIPFWRLKKISNNFLILPVQALRCSLMDVQPADSIKGWQEEAITFVRQLVFKPLSANVAGYGPSQLLIVLNETSTGQDICINAALVQHGYASSTGPASFLGELQVVPEKLVSNSPPSQFQDPLNLARQSASMDITYEGIMPTQSSTSSSPIPKSSSPSVVKSSRKAKSESPKPMMPGSYKPADKKTKSSKHKDDNGPKPAHMQIIVSKVVSPGHFYIQPCPTDELSEMMISLQNHYRGREPEQMNWSPGDFCVAVRPEDIRWYRAKILEINKEEVKVFLPDYGFTETVTVRCLRKLDEEFHSQPMFSLQCHFAEICPAGDITKWSQTSCETFDAIVKDHACYIVSKGELDGASLPVDILIREFVPGDALNPDRVEFNSVSQKLLKKGLALPDRKTIGMLVAAEGAKASVVTIPPKPLVPSPDKTTNKDVEKTVDNVVKKTADKDVEKTADEDVEKTTDADPEDDQQKDAEKTEKPQEKEEVLDLELGNEQLEGSSKLNWVDIVDAEQSLKQVSAEKEKVQKSGDKEKGEEMKPGELKNKAEKAGKPADNSSANVQQDDKCVSDKSSPPEGKIGPDNRKTASKKDSDIDEGNRSQSPSSTKVTRRSKGCSIYDKLQAQQQKRKDSSGSQSSKSDSGVGSGDCVSKPKKNEKPAKLKDFVVKDDEILVELGESAVEEELPKPYTEPPLPTTDTLDVVPTYVDWSCVIYGHIVPQCESPDGRFGFILKEKTLETIMQDNYLERHGLHRAKIPRDGNCLFRAFAQGVFHDQSKQGELREMTVRAMDEDWDVIQESVGVEDKESYLTAMRQNGSYGGEPEIQTLCTVLNVQAVIHLGGLNYPIQRRTYGQTSSRCIQLVYISDGNYDGGHYDLAVASQEEADEVNVVYEKWREMRVRQLQSFGAFEDNSTYDESLLGQLMDHLQKCHENSLPDYSTTYYPGRPVVSLYTDDCFYRAVVKEVHDDGITMLYVDFGNSEKIQPDQIRVKNTLSEIPIQCYKFVLHDIYPNTHDLKWPVKALEYIHSLVVTKQCSVKLQSPPVEGKPLQVTITMDDGKDLGRYLVEMGVAVTAAKVEEAVVSMDGLVESADDHQMPALEVSSNNFAQGVVANAYLPMWDPYPGMIAAVVVTHVESPNQVYLQRSLCVDDNDPGTQKVNACLQKLATMTEELQTQAEFYPKLSDIRPGVACCALYDVDERWYRGEVVSIKTGSSPMVVVLFVDYGNKELVAPENVRAPPDDMISLPAQASLCKLAGVCPPTGTDDWVPETKDILTDYVVSKCLVASVKSVDNGIEVSLFEYEKFHEECLEERTDLLVYYPMLQSGLIQIHNVTEDGNSKISRPLKYKYAMSLKSCLGR